MRLKGKVALITGGDSRVGRKIASLLARQGASVVLCGLNFEQGAETAARLEAAGGKARFILADVSIPSDVQAVVHEAIATYGRLDILCNNCSSWTFQTQTIASLREEAWDRILEMNLRGTFLCSKYALPFLMRSGQGSIINLVPCRRLDKPQLVEAVSQGGLLSLTHELADELADYNIRTNLIWPHFVAPQAIPKRLPRTSLLAHRVFVMSAHSASPVRTIARAVLYLACNESAQVNGAVVMIKASDK